MDMNKSYTQHQQKLGKKSRSSSGKKRKKDTVKVVYISTPMKVTTSAAKFRAIVQGLTGRESDVVRIMETSGGADTWTTSDHHHDHVDSSASHDHCSVGPPLLLGPNNNMWASPPSSEELIDPFDNGVLVKAESSLLFDQFCHHLDILGAWRS